VRNAVREVVEGTEVVEELCQSSITAALREKFGKKVVKKHKKFIKDYTLVMVQEVVYKTDASSVVRADVVIHSNPQVCAVHL
jgi:hypothetical protein